MEVRLLSDAEIATLAPTFQANGVELPDPATSFIMGAVENSEVVAFLVAQLRVHAEPMWIKPGHESVFRSLVHSTEDLIKKRIGVCDVFLFAPPGKVFRLAQLAGMRAEPWTVMTKRVVPDEPLDSGPEILSIEESAAEVTDELRTQ